MVLYHGTTPWQSARKFTDLFGLNPSTLAAFQNHLLRFEPVVDDFTRHTDEQLRERMADAVTTLTLLSLKHARSSADLPERLLNWADLLRVTLAAPGGAVAFRLIQRYILEASPHVALEFFEGPLALRLPLEAKEQIMTTGQQLIERGRQEGRGAVILALLEHRFGKLPEPLSARIRGAPVAELDRWAIRILDAATLAEVLGD
jgi:hypothetical protein